jgi:predicted metal-dependent phosphoesterase TrpH
MNRADLHAHTRYSDGAFTPWELVREAQRCGLAAVAVTDHDTLAGVAEARAAGAACGVEVIGGVEITARVGAQEVHVLGYFFGDSEPTSTLAAALRHAQAVREQRVRQLVIKLNELGVPLTLAEVAAGSERGTVGRPHVAQALVRRGVVRSVEEAFERFLKAGQPAYVERYRMEAAEAIGHVRRAGGVAVLAHPGLNRVDDRLGELRDQGLAGLEVWHSRHSAAQTEHYRKRAEQLGLIATGGSDCHGPQRGGPLLGTVTVDYEVVERLRAVC